MTEKTLIAYLHKELDDGVLMSEEVTICHGKVQSTYFVDYEQIKPISANDFLDIVRYGMQLAANGYTNIEVKED